jgi:predicted kinase
VWGKLRLEPTGSHAASLFFILPAVQTKGPRGDRELALTSSTAPRQARPVARAHLVIGPVGAGKSTFAFALAREHAAARLTLDDWMATLFSVDRPQAGVMQWYVERTERCMAQIWKVALDLLEIGTNVVLEIGLIQRHAREAFYDRASAHDVDFSIYVLEAPREVRRDRVLRRNAEKGATFSMDVPPEIFELASDLWEPPTEDECAGREVRFVSTA